MSVSDGAVSNKGAPDPFERMKQRPPRTSQGGGGSGMSNAYPDYYNDPYNQPMMNNNNYQEESDAAFRAAVTRSGGGGGGGAPPRPYGDDYDSPKWKGFMAVTDGPDPIDPLQQQRDEQLRKERERMQQEQQQQQPQPPRPMGEQPPDQFTQSHQSTNNYSDLRSSKNASNDNLRARAAVQERMAAEMAKYGQSSKNNNDNNMDIRQVSTWSQQSTSGGPPRNDPYGPDSRDYNDRQPTNTWTEQQHQQPAPWMQQQPDEDENSSGYWSKYMSVSDGPDPVEAVKSYDRRKAEWEEENARWEAAQNEEQEREAQEEAARLEAERKAHDQQEMERRRLEDLERRKAELMSVDNQPQDWEQHQARARARNEMAEQMAQDKLYAQMERARKESIERELERERSIARYRVLRAQLEAERQARSDDEALAEARARIEAEERARKAEEEMKILAQQEKVDHDTEEERTRLDAAKIEAEIRAKAEKEEKAKAEEAARKWEEAVARAKAKIMAEEMMKSESDNEEKFPPETKRIESIDLSFNNKSTKITANEANNTENTKTSRADESTERATLDARLTLNENMESQSSTGNSFPDIKKLKSGETPPKTLGVTPQKKKYGSSAAAFNIVEANNSPRRSAPGDKKELTMADLARKYKDVDMRPKNSPVASPSEKPNNNPVPPPKDYFATRIEEARKRALLASIKAATASRDSRIFVKQNNDDSRTMTEIDEVEEANKSKRLDLSSRQQYFANRIEEARKRALESAAARKAARSVADIPQPRNVSLQSGSKQVEKGSESIPDMNAAVDKKEYFADRIAASRKRALLASIEAATTSKDSKIFVRANIASTREKAAAQASEEEVERLADEPLTVLQEYFANRVASCRKSELLAQIMEVSMEDSPNSSQHADDEEEKAKSTDKSSERGPMKVNLKSSSPSSLEEFKKMFSFKSKMTEGPSDIVEVSPKEATELSEEASISENEAMGKSEVRSDITTSSINDLDEGAHVKTATHVSERDSIETAERLEVNAVINASGTNDLSEGLDAEIDIATAKSDGSEMMDKSAGEPNITASLTNGVAPENATASLVNGAGEHPKGEVEAASISNCGAEVKSTTEDISKAAALSILGIKPNGDVNMNGKAKCNGKIDGKPTLNVENLKGENESNGKAHLNGKKTAAEKSPVEIGVNGTARNGFQERHNGEGELPCQPKATNPKEISPKAK